MVKYLKMQWFVVCLILLAVTLSQSSFAGQISGQSKKWHKVTLTFDGPQTSEKADPNPFLYYRLDVNFTHQNSGKSYLVIQEPTEATNGALI